MKAKAIHTVFLREGVFENVQRFFSKSLRNIKCLIYLYKQEK